MLRFALILVMAGCGPYGSSQVGRTCDAGQKVNHCASPTTYAACDTSSDFSVWREYPCASPCDEGGECNLMLAKHGTACPASWEGVRMCKGARVMISCVDGEWFQRGCDSRCLDPNVCYDFACQC